MVQRFFQQASGCIIQGSDWVKKGDGSGTHFQQKYGVGLAHDILPDLTEEGVLHSWLVILMKICSLWAGGLIVKRPVNRGRQF